MAGAGFPRRLIESVTIAVIASSALASLAPVPPALAAGSLAGKVVVLNPEEGGSDPGGISGGVEEKSINLPTALDVGALLTQVGARVVYTRSTDVTVSLAARAALANKVHADAFITIAANALNDPNYSGVVTFYGKRTGYVGGATLPTGVVSRSRDLAQAVQAGVVQATGAIDRGIQQQNFYVLGYADVPSILIETGFMTNAAELQRLVSPSYQEIIAEGIATGVAQFLSGQGASPTPPTTDTTAATTGLSAADATYLSDVTYPDHTVVSPGQTITKTWRVTNDGTIAWDNTYQLVLQPGATIEAPASVPLPAAQPGQTVDVSVPVTVPDGSGSAEGTWRLTGPDGLQFGDSLSILVDTPGAVFSPFWVETTQITSIWSAGGASSSPLGKLGQWSYLQVTGPQQGSRLPVTEPTTNLSGFVDATAVGPAGPPPAGYTAPPVTPPFTPFWVETTRATPLFSAAADPSVTFGTAPQWSPLLVLAPQSDQRFYVRNPATGGTAFVDAAAVGPSGPPSATSPDPAASPTAAPVAVQSYVVRPGDTLSGIAKAFDVSAATIAKANDISDPNAIVSGQTIQIPGGTPPFTPFWVENFVKTPLWSGTDANAAQFSVAALFTPMRVLAPAVNGRYLVRVGTAGGIAYVNADAVGPAGAPK